MFNKKYASKSFHVRVMTMDAELEFDLQVYQETNTKSLFSIDFM